MSKRFLLFAQRTDACETLARELRARGSEVEMTDSITRVRERVEADDVDEIVIDALTMSTAEAVARRVHALSPECSVVLVRTAVQEGTANPIDGTATFRIRAERLAGLLAAGKAGARPALAIESDRMIKVLEVLVGLFEIDDPYLGGFSSAVARLSGEIARGIGMDKESLDEVVTAALLRDIGNVGVGSEATEHHVEWGVRLLEHIDFSGKILPIIRHHHERYDGTGYPDALKGREIPLGARIIAAAESLATTVSDRPDRPAKPIDLAIEQLMAAAGTQFDPEVVEVLSKIVTTDAVTGLIGRQSRIVIVDNETEYRRLLRMRLLNEGFEVQVLDELPDGFGPSEHDAPSLVLASVGQDSRELFEAMDRLHSDDNDTHVPVAVLARAENRDVKLEALRHGVEDFILKGDDLEEITARVRNILTRERRRRGGGPRRQDGVTGRLENLSVQDIVQMLCVGNKTACVRIAAGSKQSMLSIQDGRVVHAECAGLVGEEALRRIVALDTGEFQILHGVLPENVTIESTPMVHMIEAARQVDVSLGALDFPEDPVVDTPQDAAPDPEPPAPPRRPFVIRSKDVTEPGIDPATDAG